MNTSTTFKKNDNEKLRWTKFAWGGAEWVMDIMTFGAEKYGWDNWRLAEGEDRERYVDAAIRHIKAHCKGERLDPESGRPHLAHAACSLVFYLEKEPHDKS